MHITIDSDNMELKGFRYFWMKTVKGFDDTNHCAKCLIGEYVQGIAKDMAANIKIPLNNGIEFDEGTYLYLCGVTQNFKYNNNFHMALKAKAGATVEMKTFMGDRVIIEGAELVEFDSVAAYELYPYKSASYLTCRNFQFGAHVFT